MSPRSCNQLRWSSIDPLSLKKISPSKISTLLWYLAGVLLAKFSWLSSNQTRSYTPLSPSERTFSLNMSRLRAHSSKNKSWSKWTILSSSTWTMSSRMTTDFTSWCRLLGAVSFTKSWNNERGSRKIVLDFMRHSLWWELGTCIKCPSFIEISNSKTSCLIKKATSRLSILALQSSMTSQSLLKLLRVLQSISHRKWSKRKVMTLVLTGGQLAF